MKSDEHIINSEEELPDKEVITQMRVFAELIFEAWREQRSVNIDKESSPKSLQADGHSSI
jgi:hypothetical protein